MQCEVIDQGYNGERQCHFKAKFVVNGRHLCKLHYSILIRDVDYLIDKVKKALATLQIQTERATEAMDKFSILVQGLEDASKNQHK